MQIIETQAFSIEEVARMFNIAPHKIKSLKQVDQ
jgi:phage portal protein BeeE